MREHYFERAIKFNSLCLVLEIFGFSNSASLGDGFILDYLYCMHGSLCQNINFGYEQMNANELADMLEDTESYFSQDIDDRDYGMICKASTVLRQQQLKIEALEDEVSSLKLKIFTRKKWGSDIISDGGLDPRNNYEALRKAQEK